MPRAFVTYRAASAPADPDVLAALSDETFDPLVQSIVEGPPPFVAADDAPPRGHAATFVRDDETVVEIDVTLERLYAPSSVRLGGLSSALGLCGVVALCFPWTRRRRVG